MTGHKTSRSHPARHPNPPSRRPTARVGWTPFGIRVSYPPPDSEGALCAVGPWERSPWIWGGGLEVPGGGILQIPQPWAPGLLHSQGLLDYFLVLSGQAIVHFQAVPACQYEL